MKNILLGVTGSVAAIKTKPLVERLREVGNVEIVLTRSAEYFVKADLPELKRLGVRVRVDSDEWPDLGGHYALDAPILHIELRRWANAFLIAPLDAHSLAKIRARARITSRFGAQHGVRFGRSERAEPEAYPSIC